MKKKFTYIAILMIGFVFQSCTEEITLEQPDFVPKIVIEANIDWNKVATDDNKTQKVRITKTVPFTSQDIVPVLGATVNIYDSDGFSMATFTNNDNDEFYETTDFSEPTVGETYKMVVVAEGKTFEGEDVFTSIVDLDPSLFMQETISGFGGDVTRIDVIFENEVGVPNSYLLEIEDSELVSVFPTLEVLNDESFDDSNEMSLINNAILNDDYETGQELGITLYGISKRYEDYMNKVILQTGGSGGPFSTAPAKITGNIVNVNDTNNPALGFFSMNQFVKATYTIK